MQRKKLSTVLLPLFSVLAIVFLYFNYQNIIDQVVVARYQPSSQLSQIVSDINFTSRGKFLFFATQPELSERDSFNKHCEKKAEQTVVLGCYLAPQHIYIYNITDPRLSGVRQVTSAHEMLHAAYDRLDNSTKKRVNSLIEQALPEVEKTEPDLASRLKIYETTEPGERDNELHSILGTEATTLPAELETYYKQYFADRSVITKYASQYDKVFNDVKNEQDRIVAELNALSDEISSLSEQYKKDSEQLNSDINAFNQKADTEDGFATQAEFNSSRAELISRRDALEAERTTINSKIDQYEAKRKELESINVKVKDLNQKIDSTSVPSI